MRGVDDVTVADAVDSRRSHISVRVHQRVEALVHAAGGVDLNNADLDDAVPEGGGEAGCLDVKDGEHGLLEGHRALSSAAAVTAGAGEAVRGRCSLPETVVHG